MLDEVSITLLYYAASHMTGDLAYVVDYLDSRCRVVRASRTLDVVYEMGVKKKNAKRLKYAGSSCTNAAEICRGVTTGSYLRLKFAVLISAWSQH